MLLCVGMYTMRFALLYNNMDFTRIILGGHTNEKSFGKPSLVQKNE